MEKSIEYPVHEGARTFLDETSTLFTIRKPKLKTLFFLRNFRTLFHCGTLSVLLFKKSEAEKRLPFFRVGMLFEIFLPTCSRA